MSAAASELVPADHWFCSDCARWDRVDDRDLCDLCGPEHDLARFLDMVLETDHLAYQLQELHWRAWDRLTDGDGLEASDLGERIYHGEAEVALSTWIALRERQRYTIHDLHVAGYRLERPF